MQNKTRTEKDQEVLGTLLKSLEKREGKEIIEQSQAKIKKVVIGSMYREAICQMIALEKPVSRRKFFMLYPEYVAHYMLRNKDKKPVQ
jgi:Mg/Co/Ni transporter MgtE